MIDYRQIFINAVLNILFIHTHKKYHFHSEVASKIHKQLKINDKERIKLNIQFCSVAKR